MANFTLTPDILALVAERFKVLSEPARLSILNCLRDKEMTVTELMEATGLGQANASKHLRVLNGAGFVERRKDGLYVYYRILDQDVFQLCDIMCGRLATEHETRSRLFGTG